VFRAILDRLNDKPLDPDIDDPALDLAPGVAENQREIFEILAHGEALGSEALRGAFKGAVRDDGRFVAPLVLLAGELTVAFDGLDALRATVATVTPLAAGDKNVQTALEAAREFLKTPDLLSAAATAEGLRLHIKESYAQGKREPPFAHVETQVERTLLEHRRYERRALLGGRHLRGLLRLTEESDGIPAYLPESLAEVLPMFQRFSVRVIAEAHLRADQGEAQPVTLRITALARVESPLESSGRPLSGASPPAAAPGARG
jgi:hypothetical protein